MYAALSQTDAGRYLIIFFVYKKSQEALILSARDMENNKQHLLDEYKDVAEYWDENSLADHWDQTEEAEFEISPDARRWYLVAIDPSVLTRVQSLAKTRGLTTESLVNLFLEQHLQTLGA